MLIKGEKYACDACVRGHRVSNCQHADRPLQHINKKGRPISQCTHCRTLRKSRSAHVRCECGEKNHSKGACVHEGGDSTDGCCCSHGVRCTCALKKETLDPVPESDSDEASLSSAAGNAGRRPRALTAQSEGGLTVFSNGHHKSSHKNNMAHKCGLPYVVPRAHSAHGPSASGLVTNRSVDNLPHISAIDALHSESQIKESIVSAQQEQRMVKSEHGSPLVAPMSTLDQLHDPLHDPLPPLDLSNVAGDYNFYSSIPDSELPLFSAGLSSTSIDWSHYDGLDFNNDSFTASSYSQAPSFTGFDFGSIDQPALTTTSTSGEISEAEDFGFIGESNATRPSLLNTQYGSDFDTGNSDFGDVDGYRLSTASSYIGMPQAQMLASNNVDGLDMESFMKGVPMSNGLDSHGSSHNFASESKVTQSSVSPFDESINPFQYSAEDENEAFWMNDFTSGGVSASNGRNATLEESVWSQ